MPLRTPHRPSSEITPKCADCAHFHPLSPWNRGSCDELRDALAIQEMQEHLGQLTHVYGMQTIIMSTEGSCPRFTASEQAQSDLAALLEQYDQSTGGQNA